MTIFNGWYGEDQVGSGFTGGSGGAPSGAAGGTLNGSYPNPGLVPVEAVYAAYTADVTVSANTEAGATVVVTAAPFTPNGTTDYWVEFFCPQCVPANADFIVICVFDNGVFLTRMGVHAAATNNNGVITPRIRLDGANRPTAISHTYSIRALRGATNGTLKAGAGFGAGILAPGFIDVYKII